MTSNTENTTEQPNESSSKYSDKSLSNRQVEFNQTNLKELNLVSVSPTYRQLNIATGFLTGLFFLLVVVVVQFLTQIDLPNELTALFPAGYALVIFFTAWNIVYHYFADPLLKYAVREHDLNFQSGLIFRSLVSQPILRVQHIEIKRGPLERKCNLATLQVFSAGGASYTFNIPGLEYENAIYLRQFILDHKDLASDV